MISKQASGHYFSTKTRIDEDVHFEIPVRTYGDVTIKKFSRIGRFSYLNTGTTVFPLVKIGRYCSIGRGCEIGVWDQPTDWISSSPIQYNFHMHFPRSTAKFKQVKKHGTSTGPVIGNDVWICSNTVIRRGITIGDGAVIGAGSVVTKDVPPYAIVGGVPARVIRYRFDAETIARLMAVKWWDMPVKALEDLDWSDVAATLETLEARRAALLKAKSKPEAKPVEAPKTTRAPAVALEEPAPVLAKTPKPVAAPGKMAADKIVTLRPAAARVRPVAKLVGEAANPAPKPVPSAAKNEALERARAAMKKATEARAMTDQETRFFNLLRNKMEERGVGDALFAFLKNNHSKVYVDYDLADGDDVAILNNKVQHIAALFGDRPQNAPGLTPSELKLLLRTFQSRH